MDLNRKLAKRLVLGCVMTVCVGAALVVGKGKECSSNESNAGTPVEAMDWEAELVALLKQPNAVDIARMNLLAGSGLGRGEELTLTNLVRELDAMTARVKAETARHVSRFQRAPEEFNGSEAYFKMLCLVTVLQQDFGIRYSPQRAQPVEGRIEPNETFYAEAADVFLHGLLGTRRTGTCASLPVLYAAVGRRLGYPLKLVTAKNHLFVRWDGPGERLNIEATTEGMTTFEDEYYRGWPFPMSPEEEVEERYLKSLDSREELAVFLSQRTHCLLAKGKGSEALMRIAAPLPFLFGKSCLRHVDRLEHFPHSTIMKIDQLQVMLEASPFVPFSLILPNGEKLRVPHADFAWIHPGKRSVVVALKGDVVRIVNWQMVTAIETKSVAA